MIRCIEESAVFIAIMSQNYCQSDYCKFGIDQADQQGKPIILIFIEEVPEYIMTLVIRKVFKNYTRVKLIKKDDGHRRLEPSWNQLCEAVVCAAATDEFCREECEILYRRCNK